MKNIDAFVGHSFADEDRDLVRYFLDYFSETQKLHPTFSWVHAEAAEPKELQEKVLARIEGKNVFIGICTLKEFAMPHSPKKSLRTYWPFLNSSKPDGEWKTSDWIIQEIGLAVGRGMSLILLVEGGTRKPGGLQGDVEYIPFDRNNPEGSFVKILAMLSTLTPKPSIGGSTSDTTKESGDSSADKDEVSKDEFLTPQPEWDTRRFEHAAFLCSHWDKQDELAAITDAFLESDLSAKGSAKPEWYAYLEHLKIMWSENGQLTELKIIATQQPKNLKIQTFLADAYSHVGDNLTAAEILEKNLPFAKDEITLVRSLTATAVQFAEAGYIEKATVLFEQAKTKITGEETEKILLEALLRFAKIIKQKTLEIGVMERMVALFPDNFDTRLLLAFEHSNSENADLALFHYLKIPFEKRSDSAWNNIGVSFDHFSMPEKSVSAYERASAQDNTLAMSNLAYKYMEGGFFNEAKALLESAMQHDNYHKNVPEALAKVTCNPEQEEEKLEKTLSNAKSKADFYQRIGKAITIPNHVGFKGIWKGPNCDLNFTSVGTEVRAVGFYEVEPNAFSSLLGTRSSSPIKYQVQLAGTIVGNLVAGKIQRIRKGQSASSILTEPSEDEIILLVGNDTDDFDVMEEPKLKNPRFYRLEAKA